MCGDVSIVDGGAHANVVAFRRFVAHPAPVAALRCVVGGPHRVVQPSGQRHRHDVALLLSGVDATAFSGVSARTPLGDDDSGHCCGRGGCELPVGCVRWGRTPIAHGCALSHGLGSVLRRVYGGLPQDAHPADAFAEGDVLHLLLHDDVDDALCAVRRGTDSAGGIDAKSGESGSARTPAYGSEQRDAHLLVETNQQYDCRHPRRV